MFSSSSHRYSDRWFKPVSKLVVLCVASIALMFADDRFAFTNSIKSATLTVLYPLQWAANLPLQTYNEASVFLSDQTKLHQKNTELEAENVRLKAELGRQRSIEREFAELKSLQQKAQTEPQQGMVSAEVISNGRDPLSDKLIINQGSSAGITLGQGVIDGKGLIGQITSVHPFNSEVTLLLDNKQVIPVMIERTGERTLLYGTGNGIELRYLPIEADLKEGDVLVTSGLDDVYPSGIPVASVINAKKNVTATFYQPYVVAVAGVKSSRHVLVVPKSVPAITEIPPKGLQ